MLNGLLRFADIRQPGSWLRTRSGRLLSGLGFAAALPRSADAARKDDRRGSNDDQNNNGGKDNREGGGGGDEKSDKDKNADAKAEDQTTGDQAENQGGRKDAESQDTGNEENQGDETEKSGERNRDENRRGDEGGGAKAEEDGGGRRADRRQDTTAESDEPSRRQDNDTDHRDGDRRDHVQEFEQAADELPVDDELGQTTLAQTNPNVVIPDIPETTAADLVVEANPDVIATVSAQGGFAFARSGGVTAFTGPDGATIIQNDAEAPTTAPEPVEPPDDGGNNDLDFTI